VLYSDRRPFDDEPAESLKLSDDSRDAFYDGTFRAFVTVDFKFIESALRSESIAQVEQRSIAKPFISRLRDQADLRNVSIQEILNAAILSQI